MPAIVVNHISEEHGYVAQQRCNCGGEFTVAVWEMCPVENGLHEHARVRCIECGMSHEFEFDITQIRDTWHAASDPFLGAWRGPFEGPYGLRRLPRDFQKHAQAIAAAFERGEINDEETWRQHRELVDSTYPRIAGRYQVFGYRKGSMGFTYLCADTTFTPQSARPCFVVCKCIGTSQDGGVRIDDVTSTALRHEAKVWLDLGEHPNIVELLDTIYVSPENTVLVLESVFPGPDGHITLADWVESKSLAWPIQLCYAKDLVRGCLYASKQIPGFVHGDLKPANLLIDVNGGYRLKITDFGLSRAVNHEIPDALTSLGTRMYMAPECWTEKTFTPQSDIYAIGLILYEMISGSHPLADLKELSEIETRHRDGIKLPNLKAPIEASLATLIKRCIATDPRERPSLREIAQMLGVDTNELNVHRDGLTASQLNNKATGLIAIGNYDDAVSLLEVTVQMEPGTSAGWTNLAVAYSKSGEIELAEAAYRQCFRLPDVSAETYAAYAAHEMRRGTRQAAVDALKACRTAIELNNSCCSAWGNMAAALNTLGRHAEAVEAAAAARKLDPAQPHTLVELAFAYMNLGRRSLARKMVEKAIAISPTFEPAHMLKRQLRTRG